MKTEVLLQCSKCKEIKAETLFSRFSRAKSGRECACKACNKKYHDRPDVRKRRQLKGKEFMVRYRLNPEIRKKHRNSVLKYKYGITINDYEEMLVKQDYSCAICGISERRVRNERLHIDHNHKTNKVRGLLCYRCNNALGILEDKNFVANAKNYLMETL